MKKSWEGFEIDESFYTEAQEQTGLAEETVDRYIDVWEMAEKIKVMLPKNDFLRLLSRPIGDLIAISQFKKEYGISKGQINKLIGTLDNSELRKQLNEYKGKADKNGGLQLIIQADGTLEAWSKGRGVYLGFIDLRPESDDPTLRDKGLTSLLKRGKIKLVKQGAK